MDTTHGSKDVNTYTRMDTTLLLLGVRTPMYTNRSFAP